MPSKAQTEEELSDIKPQLKGIPHESITFALSDDHELMWVEKNVRDSIRDYSQDQAIHVCEGCSTSTNTSRSQASQD